MKDFNFPSTLISAAFVSPLGSSGVKVISKANWKSRLITLPESYQS